MIKTMFGRITPALVLLGTISPVLAGEVGVTNSWSSGWRHGSGVSDLKVNSNRQEYGESHSSAFKLELGELPSSTSEAKAAVGKADSSGYYFAGAGGTDSRHYSETTNTQFNEASKFSFGSSTNSHSVSTFAN